MGYHVPNELLYLADDANTFALDNNSPVLEVMLHKSEASNDHVCGVMISTFNICILTLYQIMARFV